METPRLVKGEVLAEVSYQLTFEDVVSGLSHQYAHGEYAEFNHRHSSQCYRYILKVLGVPFALTIVAVSMDITSFSSTRGFVLLVLAIVWQTYVIIPVLWAILAKPSESKNVKQAKVSIRDSLKAGATHADTGPLSLRITTDGLIYAGRWGSAEYLWRGAINRIERNESLFLIVTLGRSSFIIPQRAFKTPYEAESFFNLVSDLIAKNGGGNDLDLIEHLQHHDLPCPKCRYNLRGAQTSSCPECGRRLSFGMFHDSMK